MKSHTISVNFSYPLNTGTPYVYFPGGCLDPDFGSNDKIWFASGTIRSITVSLDQSARILTTVFDMASNGMPVKDATTLQPYSLVEATATAQTQGYDVGSATHDVTIPGTVPAEMASLVPKWEQDVNWIDGMGAARYIAHFDDLDIYCGYGMAVKIDPSANVSASVPVDISVVYTPDVQGYERYRRSTYADAMSGV